MSELRASFGDAVDMWDHYEVLNKSHVDISNFGEYFITTVEMLLISQRKVHVRVRTYTLHCLTLWRPLLSWYSYEASCV